MDGNRKAVGQGGIAGHEAVAGPGPIAYVVKMFPRLSETFITNEVRELRRQGADLLLVSLMAPTGSIVSRDAAKIAETAHILPRVFEDGGGRRLLASHLFFLKRDPARYLRTLGLVARRFRRSAWKRFFQAGGLARLCVDHRVSHIHAGFAHTPTSVAVWTSRLTGLPYSFAAHAKDLYLSERRSLVHKMERARFVWTCTEANGSYLRSLGTRTPVHVGYHGIDLECFTPTDGRRNGNGFRILAVGRLVPKKGFPDLLRATVLLRDRGVSNFQVVLVGDGPERPRLEAMARHLGVEGRVRFQGALPSERVREEYSRADLVVLPSVVLANGDRDGIPNVLVEAMAMNVPVVSTRVSAIPELIRDGDTGRLIEPHAPEELADAILEVMTRSGEARERAVRACEDVSERFNLRNNVQRMAALLRGHQGPTRCLYVTADRGIPVRGHKGASGHVRQICERLAGMGLDLRVVTPNPGPEPPEGNDFGVVMDEVPPTAWLHRLVSRARKGAAREILNELERLAHNFPIARRVAEILKEQRPDFVYERYSLGAVATGLLCRRRRIPWILEVNSPLADEAARYRTLRLARLTRFLERRVLKGADHVFVVSHPLRRWALDLGVPPRRVSVLPNGVDTNRFRKGQDAADQRGAWGFTDENVVIGFSGSLKPWHGVGVLLAAFSTALREDPRLRLVYIGDGPERKALNEEVRRNGLENVVVFTGAVAHARMPLLLRATDILVAPYLPQRLFYFSPMKIVEAMAVGRPVIASNLGDIPDLVVPSCGRVVPAGHTEALKAAILDLASDPDRRKRMGYLAARRARQHDWSCRAEEIVSTAEELRGTRAPRDRLRVAYVLKMFPRFSETFIVNEILELERMDTDIRVFSMKKPTGARQEGVDRVRARVKILPRGNRPLGPAAFLAHVRCLARSPRRYARALHFALGRRDGKAFAKFLQAGVVADTSAREGIQHLHAHFASGPARVAKMASMISGIPFSFTAHAKDLYWEGHNHAGSHKLKKRIRLARFVVSISGENKQYMENLGFKVKDGRIRTVHIGLRLEDFPFQRPSQRPRGPRPLILAVGRLIEKKGFHVLVEALALLRDRGQSFRCLVAGEGPERERLERLVRERGLESRVRLVGGVPLGRLRRRYYRRARVLAQPSVIAADGDRDGIPTVLVEAMASGIPVVSTRVSGIPEAIRDGVEGFLTEPGDAGALAGRIEKLLEDDSLAERLAAAGRMRVEQDFDQKKNAGVLWKLFVRSSRGWPPRDDAVVSPGAGGVHSVVVPEEGGAVDGALAGSRESYGSSGG